MSEPTDREAALDEARTLISAGMIAELITDIRQMASAILEFAERQDRTDTRVSELASLRHRNGLIAGAALALAGTLAAVVIVLGSVLIVGYSRLTDIANANNRNGRVLVECTTPAPTLPARPLNRDDAVHECYDNAQDSQGRAVGQITDSLMVAGICARLESTEEAIRACVRERLTATTTTTQP